MKFNQTARSRWLASATAISLLTAGAVAAAVPAKSNSKSSIKTTTGTTNGMRAYFDAATGKFRQPTDQERAADAKVTASVSTDAGKKNFSIRSFADGSVRIQDTQGLLSESVIATKQPDGTLTYSFVNDAGSTTHDHAPTTTLEEK